MHTVMNEYNVQLIGCGNCGFCEDYVLLEMLEACSCVCTVTMMCYTLGVCVLLPVSGVCIYCVVNVTCS